VAHPISRVAWLRALRDHGPPQPGVILTCFVIATYMNKNTGVAFPSQKTIAKGIRGSLKTVQRNIETARRSGWLRVQVAGRNGKGWRHYAYAPAIPEGGDTSVATISGKVETPVSPAKQSRGDSDGASWRQTQSRVATSGADRGDMGVALTRASELRPPEHAQSEQGRTARAENDEKRKAAIAALRRSTELENQVERIFLEHTLVDIDLLAKPLPETCAILSKTVDATEQEIETAISALVASDRLPIKRRRKTERAERVV
jgi:hypothetical protein